MSSIKNLYSKMKHISNSVFEPETYKEFLGLMARFPNMSLYNLLLLQYQYANATIVAGEQAWKDNYGINVKSDEKAICLLRPVLVDENLLDYVQIGVFDISQLERQPEIKKEQFSISNFFYENTGCIMSYDYEGLLGEEDEYQLLDDEIIVKQYENLSNEENEKNAFKCLLSAYIDNYSGLEKDNIRNKTIIQSIKYVLCERYGFENKSMHFGYIVNCKDYSLNFLNDVLYNVVDIIDKIENTIHVEFNFLETAFINLLVTAELKEDYESIMDYDIEDDFLNQARDKFIEKMELLDTRAINQIVDDRKNNKMLTQPPYKIKLIEEL